MALLPGFFSLFLLITWLMIIVPQSKSDFITLYCSNDTTFATTSNFPNNLDTLLRSLSSNANTSPTGYHATSVAGNGVDDTIYGLFMCRGDQNNTGCGSCVSTAVRERPQRINCPRSKVGILWYDECMLRYSNQTLVGILDQNPTIVGSNPQNILGNQTAFGNIVGTTMNELVVQANDQNTGKKYAAKEVSFTASQSVYALVQCTPDLTASDCDRCLKTEIGQVNSQSRGFRVLQPSCNIRYEIYPFLDVPFNAPLPSPHPATNRSNGANPGRNARGKNRASAKVIIAIVAPTLVVAAALLTSGICLLTKKASQPIVDLHVERDEDFDASKSLQYDLGSLQHATNNFSDENKLGEGGFGCVYKGTLTDGQKIAVKKLSTHSSQGIEEFKNEAVLVAKLHHRNLVRLLGFYLAGEEKLLVYEFVPNKSLDCFLFDPEMQGLLDWRKRYAIITGIARGMLYIHQDSQLRIIHRDLKASNILLDAEMNPKISDFGMARIFGVDQTQGNTNRVVGTYGYMAPEYAMQGRFSVKSDVYSFGILVLEIISGKRNSSFYQSGNVQDLLSYAWNLWRDSIPLEFVDPAIRDSCSVHEVMRCLHLALLCIQESVDDRPAMATIVLMLDSYSVTLPVPEQPGFSLKIETDSNFGNAT